MTILGKVALALMAVSFLGGQSRAATSIILDGTFQDFIGTGSNPTPWSDWTNAGITRAAAPAGIPGDYASLPIGADLFQRFSALSNGSYDLSFLVQNQSSSSAEMVFAVQQALGTPCTSCFRSGRRKKFCCRPTASSSG